MPSPNLFQRYSHLSSRPKSAILNLAPILLSTPKYQPSYKTNHGSRKAYMGPSSKTESNFAIIYEDSFHKRIGHNFCGISSKQCLFVFCAQTQQNSKKCLYPNSQF